MVGTWLLRVPAQCSEQASRVAGGGGDNNPVGFDEGKLWIENNIGFLSR